MSKLTPSAAFLVLLLACGSERAAPPPPPPPPPPPAPVLPTEPVPEPSVEPPVEEADKPLAQASTGDEGKGGGTLKQRPEGIAVGEPNPSAPDAKPAKKGTSLYDLVEQGKAKMPVDPKKPVITKPEPAKPVVTKPEITKPEPVIPKPAPQPVKPAGKVTVPRTKNVHVEFPKGLQADLDADPRMQPFVTQVINIADKCYADARSVNPLAAGTIELVATMHSEARPDVDVRKSPTALANVVACGMGRLMSVKMPLFTGKEGQKYTIKIVFEK